MAVNFSVVPNDDSGGGLLRKSVKSCAFHSAAPCLLTYWRHGSWLDAISCPLCRQKVESPDDLPVNHKHILSVDVK